MPLLERAKELAQLKALIEGASGGRGRVVVLEGAAGIGKTRLLRAAKELADDSGVHVLTARGSELEREFPFGLVRQLFEPPLAAAKAGQRRSLLGGAASLAAPVLGLGPEEPEPGTEPAATGDPSFPILHGLHWLTSNLSDRAPLLLIVDDAHWSDPASLRFLRFLVTRLEELPVLLALAYRPDEPGAESDLLAEIASDALADVIRPAALSEDATVQLLRAAFSVEPEPDFCQACHEASGGNPFLLSELVLELVAQDVEPTARAADQVRGLAPKTIARSVLLRLARMGEPARSLARAVAVLGDGTELRLAGELAEIEQQAAAEAADGLVGAGILAPGRPVGFAHPLVRTAVYSEIAARDRAAAHASAAALLLEEGAGTDAVAVHLLATDPGADPLVAETLFKAAHEAGRRGALDVAVRYLRRALAEPPAKDARASVLLELGMNETRVYDPSAVDHLRAAVEASANGPLRATATHRLGEALATTGRMSEALGELDAAIVLAEATDRELALAIEADLLATGQVTYTLPAPAIAERLARWEPIEGNTPGERMLLAVKAYELARTGPAAAPAAELAERALADGMVLSKQPADSPLFYSLYLTLMYTDQLDLLDVCSVRALADASERGSVFGFAIVSSGRAFAAHQRGLIDDAEAEARNALNAEGPHGQLAFPRALGFLIEALVERGELAAADEELERSGLAQLGFDNPIVVTNLAASRAHLRMAQGRMQDALGDLLAVGRSADENGYRTSVATLLWARSRAPLALLQLGDRDEARRLAVIELDRARAFGLPWGVGVGLRVLGLVEGGQAGLELLRESASTLEGSQFRLEHARALTDLGAALRRANQRSEARAPLREGLALARRCGALALANRAREELSATGERVAPLSPIGPGSLTPSERRIAEMAAGGLANREIAQALFVTVKTVETHLSHVFRKLDISSRRELSEEALISGAAAPV